MNAAPHGSDRDEPAPTPAGRMLLVSGISMYVVVAGSGPDVLLLHGYPDSHALWQAVEMVVSGLVLNQD